MGNELASVIHWHEDWSILSEERRAAWDLPQENRAQNQLEWLLDGDENNSDGD